MFKSVILNTLEYKLQAALPLSVVIHILVMLMWSKNTSSPQANTPVTKIYKMKMFANGGILTAITQYHKSNVRKLMMINVNCQLHHFFLSKRDIFQTLSVLHHWASGIWCTSNHKLCIFHCTPVINSYDFFLRKIETGKGKNKTNKENVKVMEWVKMEWM